MANWHSKETLEQQTDEELEALREKLAMLYDDNHSDVESECSPHCTWSTLDFWDETIHTISEMLQRRKGILPIHWNQGDELACDRAIEGDPVATDSTEATCHWCKQIYWNIQEGILQAKQGEGRPISELWDGIEDVE